MNKDDFERKLEEALVFGRRSSLARTPPSTPPPLTVQQEDQAKVVQIQAGRLYVSDDNDSIPDIDSPFAKKRKRETPDIDSPFAKKRKRETYNVKHIEKGEDSSMELTEVLTFMEKLYNKTDSLRKQVKESTKTKTEIKSTTLTFMEKLYNKTDSLRKQVKESTKTKTEIKSTTRELVNIVGILRKKMTNLKAKHAELAAKSTEYGKQATSAEAQIGKCLTPKVPEVTKKPITEALTSNVHVETARVMSSISTQTDWEDVEVVRMQRDNEVRNVID
ncbi:hypothetical protein QE152_g15948 [Popillia japonica]|uniref:Uncharacterized protein n=1 Tax=Popillia japonica TaxID=7064 RepID=A0AAW1L4G3_POPJA